MSETSTKGSGVFDRSPVKESDLEPKPVATPVSEKNEEPVPEKKQDFLNPHQQHAKDVSERNETARKAGTKSADDIIAESMASSIGGDDGISIEKEIEELQSISPEDLELAEELIFKGYVEKTISVERLKNLKITLCSTTADDVDMVQDMVFDFLRANEDEKGESNVSNNKVASVRQMYQLALAYKGSNGEDISNKDRSSTLDVIKRAMLKLIDVEYEGDTDKHGKLSALVRDAIKKRALLIRRLPTALIDFISREKQKFDEKMFEIMSTKNILPKS